MTKKVVFIFCLLFLTVIIVPYCYANSDVNEYIVSLKNAWDKSECNTLSTNMSIYAKLDIPIFNVEDMELTVNNLIELLKLNQVPEIEWVEYDGYREASVTSTIKDNEYITISLQTFYNEEETKETNVLINIDGDQDIDRLLEFQDMIINSLNELSANGQINCSILGFVDSDSPEEDVIDLIEKLVKFMQCDITDFFVDNQVISLCGNSPLLNEKPYGWSFNMQISARKDDEGKYYIWLGYPAIASSY